ncbi:MAG: hypothetical protein AB7O39_15970 [Flavobacteriaceae bacterium]
MPTDRRDPPMPTDTDLAQDKMGRNSLQGDDQESVRNQRRAVPDAKQEPDDVIESFEKLDKDERARRDLGRGAREAVADEEKATEKATRTS